METDATRTCALLVGLPEIVVLGVGDRPGEPLRIHVETTATTVGCAACGTRAWLKGQRRVALVDLPAFGRPAVLVWHKRRWLCPEPACEGHDPDHGLGLARRDGRPHVEGPAATAHGRRAAAQPRSVAVRDMDRSWCASTSVTCDSRTPGND